MVLDVLLYEKIRDGNSLIRSSFIPSFRSNQMSDSKQFAQIDQDKWANVSKSLKSLKGNEQSWANHSGRSRQKSDHEWFAKLTQRNLADERFAQKVLTKKILKMLFYYVLLKVFYIKNFKKMSESLIFAHLPQFCEWIAHFAQNNERCEQMAHFAHQKWATMSDSLRSLRGNEWCKQIAHQKWANEWITHFFERITHSFIFGQKTSGSLGNQMSKFPALEKISYSMVLEQFSC